LFIKALLLGLLLFHPFISITALNRLHVKSRKTVKILNNGQA